MDDLISIGEFSERSGLSPKRLRSYADAGLLVPAAVDSVSGYRYYSPGQVRHGQLIDALRRAEVPLVEIQRLLRSPSSEALDRWSRQVEVDQASRREALQLARRLLALDDEDDRSDPREHSRSERTTMFRSAIRSATGRVRETNQDGAIGLEQLVAVADGMGPPPGGETASSLTLALVESAFRGRSADELEAAVRAANRAVFERSTTDDRLAGMGTTVCAVGLINGADLVIANVGDSRAYLVREGMLHQLTDDHSVVAELIRQGELAEADAADHPKRSVLTRAIGVAQTVDVDIAVRAAEPGDRLLICSDGLYNETSEQLMQSVTDTAEDVEQAAEALLKDALANGGHDNITVIIADIEG